jgi:hypothetical protein
VPPGPCHCRCTCHKVAACARTPCHAAAARNSGHHLPCGRLAQLCGTWGNAVWVSLREPGSRRSSPATDRADCAPQPWRGPGVARPRLGSSWNTLKARGADDGAEARTAATKMAPLEWESDETRFLRGPSAERQVGSSWAPRGPHPHRVLRTPPPLPRGERDGGLGVCGLGVFTSCLYPPSPLYFREHTAATAALGTRCMRKPGCAQRSGGCSLVFGRLEESTSPSFECTWSVCACACVCVCVCVCV